MGRPFLETAVVVVGSAVLVAGCGRAATDDQPRTLEAAVAAEQEKQDRGQAGDFAGEWLLFSRKVREALSQDDYVSYAQACYSTGNPVKVTGGRMDGNDKAIVRLELPGHQVTRTMVYEDGQWVQEPVDTFYEQPLSQLIEKCGSDANEPAKDGGTPDTSLTESDPIESTAQLDAYIDRAREPLERSCFQVEKSVGAQCMADANSAATTFEELALHLPDQYPKTRLAAEESAHRLKRWRDECIPTEPDSAERQSCIPYQPLPVLLLDVQQAWHQERRDMGLGE